MADSNTEIITPPPWQDILDNIPQEAVDAFWEGFRAKSLEYGHPHGPRDEKARAGISAALKAMYELQLL